MPATMSGVSYKLHQSETGDGFTRAGSLGDDIPRDWKQTLFGIGPESIQSGKPKSRLIYPLSIFGIGWIAVTALLLLYTAIATPPMIALHWLDLECTVIPTLYFDVVVDCFFLVDIVLNFFTGIFHSDDYIDDPKKVARFYLKGMFWFDCITSFPISFVELAIKAACEGANVDSERLRFVRAIKPVRWFKIARVMKIAKAGPLIHMMMDYWNISPKQGKTISILTQLIMSIHLMACAWWLFKVLFMTFEEINQFLDDQAWGRHERHSIHTPQGKIEAYIISLYVTTMTITTVGYGDISADNSSERVGYIALFIAGALIWGNLLAGLGEIHQAASKRDQEKMARIQKTLDFLVANDCPPNLRRSIIRWTRFSEEHADDNIQKKLVMADLPKNLRRNLVQHLYSKQVNAVPLFAYIESLESASSVGDSRHFLNDIFCLLQYRTFAPGEALVDFSEHANRLLMIVSGRVWVEFDHPTLARPKMSLREGDYIGDMAILGERDWAKSTCFRLAPQAAEEDPTEIQVSTFPNEYVIVLTLTALEFMTAVSSNSLPLQAVVCQFHEKSQDSRRAMLELGEGASSVLKAISNWEMMTLKLQLSNREQFARSGHPVGFKVDTKMLKKAAAWVKQQVNAMAKDTDTDSPLRVKPPSTPATPSNRGGDWDQNWMLGAFENLEKRLVERLDDGLLALQHKVSAAVDAHQTGKTTALIDAACATCDTGLQQHDLRAVSNHHAVTHAAPLQPTWSYEAEDVMFEEALSSHDQSCRRQEALQEPEPQLSLLANQFSQPDSETTVGATSINPEPRPHDCQSSSPLAQSFDKEHERITDTEGGSNCQDQDSRIWRHHDARKDAAVMQIFGDAAARVVAGRSRSLPHSGKGTPRRLPGRIDRSTAIKQNIKLMQDLNQVLLQQHTSLNRQGKQQLLAVDAGLVLNDSSVNDSFKGGGLSPQIFHQASTRRSSTPLRAKVSDSDFVTGGKDLFGFATDNSWRRQSKARE